RVGRGHDDPVDRAQHGCGDGAGRPGDGAERRGDAVRGHSGRGARRCPRAGGLSGGAVTLTVEGIDAGYGAAQVLRDLSLAVEAGEILCLMGRNGAGKTTLMRAIMGLIPLMAGRVL